MAIAAASPTGMAKRSTLPTKPLRALRALGLKAALVESTSERLAETPLPVLAETRGAATTNAADIPVVAQLVPHDWIEFRVCDHRDALRALIAQERRLMS